MKRGDKLRVKGIVTVGDSARTQSADVRIAFVDCPLFALDFFGWNKVDPILAHLVSFDESLPWLPLYGVLSQRNQQFPFQNTSHT